MRVVPEFVNSELRLFLPPQALDLDACCHTSGLFLHSELASPSLSSLDLLQLGGRSGPPSHIHVLLLAALRGAGSLSLPKQDEPSSFASKQELNARCGLRQLLLDLGMG